MIDALARPSAYPHAVDQVQVRQTHISVVFLAGPWVYKIKKPVKPGFLDFSTLEKRRHFCEEEVRLNRRLAPGIYLGVVPVVATSAGLCFEAAGEPVEWAVKMVRLAAEATLQRRLRHGQVQDALIEQVARRIADFHARAERGERIASFGRFDVVAGNARDNLDPAQAQIGTTLSRPVWDRLHNRLETELAGLKPLIDRRVTEGKICDTHGDLHLDHVYYFPDRPPPGDLLIIDCIEFSERFRFADPVADMAFLSMDLRFHGRRDLADRFADAYFLAAGDGEGRLLLPFYTAYRACVRGKVEALKLAEREVPEADRARALVKARAYWLLALGELEGGERRPCLLLVGGLPGSGKSTLARQLADAAGFRVIRSDVVRKELADGSPQGAGFEEGIYAPDWTERTYGECLRRAEELLFDGQRVLIDASFQQDRHRQQFLDAARRWGVPGLLMICQADPAIVRQRLRLRRHDASDADWDVHRQVAARWQEPGAETSPALTFIDSTADPASVTGQALQVLKRLRLL